MSDTHGFELNFLVSCFGCVLLCTRYLPIGDCVSCFSMAGCIEYFVRFFPIAGCLGYNPRALS